MRIHTAVAALILVAASVLQHPAAAQAVGSAQLRLVVVDENNAALPSATVTIFTLDGQPAMTVMADDKGVAAFPALPTGLAEIYARQSGFGPYIEAARLQRGNQTLIVTLHPESETSSSGS